jgi:hypothetical protein
MMRRGSTGPKDCPHDRHGGNRDATVKAKPLTTPPQRGALTHGLAIVITKAKNFAYRSLSKAPDEEHRIAPSSASTRFELQ